MVRRNHVSNQQTVCDVRTEPTPEIFVNAAALSEMPYSPGGEYSQKKWVGVWGPLPKTLTLFMTKVCDIPYPIYDLTKNSRPSYL